PVDDPPERLAQKSQPRRRPTEQLDGQFELGPERRSVLRVDAGQILLADVEPGQQGQRDGAPRLVRGAQPEDDKDMAVDVCRTGWARGRVVVDACALDVR